MHCLFLTASACESPVISSWGLHLQNMAGWEISQEWWFVFLWHVTTSVSQQERFSSGSLTDQARQDKNVTKCDKWLSVTVHTLLCHQGSNQRDWHLTLLLLSAHRSQDVLHPQLQFPKVNQGYERNNFSSMVLKSTINTLFIYRIQINIQKL